MQDVRKILVPYDFSPLSQKALGSALLLTQLVNAELHVVHVEVLHGLPITESSMVPAAPAETLRKRIEEDNAYINDLYKDVVIFYAVGRGIAAGPIILEYLKLHQMDLVVMGTHGRHGLLRMFLGSVAEEIVRNAPCNVLTIPGDATSFLEFDKLKRILVPIDFSEHSAQALLYARKVTTLSAAQLDLVHVLHFPSFTTVSDAGVFSIADFDTDLEVKAVEHLKEFYAQVIGDAALVSFSSLEGPAADEIVSHAAETKCDLIVIGTHGLTGIDRFLLGSVASKTIRRAPCPVLVICSDVHSTPNQAAVQHDATAKKDVITQHENEAVENE